MDEVEGEETRLLVKWAGAPYSACTYELVKDLEHAGQVKLYSILVCARRWLLLRGMVCFFRMLVGRNGTPENGIAGCQVTAAASWTVAKWVVTWANEGECRVTLRTGYLSFWGALFFSLCPLPL